MSNYKQNYIVTVSSNNKLNYTGIITLNNKQKYKSIISRYSLLACQQNKVIHTHITTKPKSIYIHYTSHRPSTRTMARK